MVSVWVWGVKEGRTAFRHLHEEKLFTFFGLCDVCWDEWILLWERVSRERWMKRDEKRPD